MTRALSQYVFSPRMYECALMGALDELPLAQRALSLKSLLRAHAPCKCVRLRRAARRVGVTAHERFFIFKSICRVLLRLSDSRA